MSERPAVDGGETSNDRLLQAQRQLQEYSDAAIEASIKFCKPKTPVKKKIAAWIATLDRWSPLKQAIDAWLEVCEPMIGPHVRKATGSSRCRHKKDDLMQAGREAAWDVALSVLSGKHIPKPANYLRKALKRAVNRRDEEERLQRSIEPAVIPPTNDPKDQVSDQVVYIGDGPWPKEPYADGGQADYEAREELWACCLDALERAIIFLTYSEGLTVNEIAQRLDERWYLIDKAKEEVFRRWETRLTARGIRVKPKAQSLKQAG